MRAHARLDPPADDLPLAAPATASSLVGHSPSLMPARLPPRALLLGPALLLAIWEAASRLGWLSPETLTSPSQAVLTGLQMLRDGSLLPHLLASAGRAYSGLFIGLATGVVLALLSGLTRSGEALIDGLVQVKRAIPTLALIPLAILWLGIGEAMKIFLIATAVFVPIYINTHAARHRHRSCGARPYPASFSRHLLAQGSAAGGLAGLLHRAAAGGLAVLDGAGGP